VQKVQPFVSLFTVSVCYWAGPVLLQIDLLVIRLQQ
jgi:hypothetical protein